MRTVVSSLFMFLRLACLSGWASALHTVPLPAETSVQGVHPSFSLVQPPPPPLPPPPANTTASKWKLMPWADAKKKAVKIVQNLTSKELSMLVRGEHFSMLTVGPDPGYYVGNTAPIPRHNIPALKMQDASQGFRVTAPNVDGTTTSWPCMLALAATWDPKAVKEVSSAIGKEFRGKGANVILGPGLNVHRVARNGRNFEYLSGEDPYLGARLAAAHVQGLQEEGVMATAKHFAFNEQETNRMTESSIVDAKTAWELYYPPFEAAVNAGLSAVMCAYNRVNGTYSSENPDMLVRDLQQGMGFSGFVMSDWGAVHSTRALESGLAMEMPGMASLLFGQMFGVLNDTALTQVPPKALTDAAERVLTSIFHMNLDKQKGCTPPCFTELATNQTGPKHRNLARKAAENAITILKNDGNVLPILPGKVKTIALLGHADVPDQANGAMDYYAGGGSGKVGGNAVVTPLQGLLRRAGAANITVLHGAATVTDAVKLAQSADLAIVVGATTSGEGADRPNLNLDGIIDSLIPAVAAVKPTVVLMQTPGAVVTPWRNNVSGIAHVFLAGEETGSAWASVLFGDVEPSGRLPIMMPATDLDQIHPGADIPVIYSEGLFTSYRNPNFTAAFPFGHGLTYTNFTYGTPQEVTGSQCKADACVKIKITNSGLRNGTEVVQAYLHYPNDKTQPHRVLKGFKRTSLLAPNSSEEVTLEFKTRDLSVYRVSSGWVRANNLEVHIGSSSMDIKHNLTLGGSR